MLDARRETRWPAYAAVATAHGVLSSLSVPLTSPAAAPGGARRAALNLYATSSGAFDDHSQEAARAVAVIAGSCLSDSHILPSLANELAAAAAAGEVVRHACRAVAAAEGCSAQEAFEDLAATAQSTGRSLVQVAHDAVQGPRDARRTHI